MKSIEFNFPIYRDGQEVRRLLWEKGNTVETVVLLSQLKQKPDDYINVTIELDDVDITSAETKATYDEIKKPIGILQGKSLPRILRQNKYVTKRKNS